MGERTAGLSGDRVLPDLSSLPVAPQRQEEMRLAGAAGIEEANRFLERWHPVYNQRFALEALEPGDLHRRLPKSVVLDEVLCIKGFRTVNEGYIVKWRGRTYVLDKPSLTLRRQKLVGLEKFDGSLALRSKGRELAYREALEPPRRAPKPAQGEEQEEAPKMPFASEPSLAASALRERTAPMRPEVLPLLRTGNIHFAFTCPKRMLTINSLA